MKTCLILTAFAVAIGLATRASVTAQVAEAPRASSIDNVWYWFATCGGPTMVLEIRFDSTSILKSTFPICRGFRGSASEQGQRSNLEFQFTPDRDIIWNGYQDTDDTTVAREVLYGSVWQAGADSGWLTLGLSFTTSSKILMNTIHLAHPNAKDSSEIAAGLVVVTYISKDQD